MELSGVFKWGESVKGASRVSLLLVQSAASLSSFFVLMYFTIFEMYVKLTWKRVFLQ